MTGGRRTPLPASEKRASDAALLWTARVVAAVGLAGALWLAARHPFHRDEIEHVHSAWLASLGLRPYSDFFEHHHPVLWHAFALLLPLSSQTAATLVALRGLTFGAFVGIVALMACIARRTGRDPTLMWTALALLLSMSAFVANGYEIRPDVPQALLGMLSLLWLLSARRQGSRVRFALAGLAAGVAIGVSLKAVLLVAAYAAAAGLCWRRQRVAPSALLAFTAGCVVPPLLLLAQLARAGSLADYYATNWTFNALVSAARLSKLTPGSLLFVNVGFVLLAVAGGLHLLLKDRDRSDLQFVAASGAALILLFLATGRKDARTALQLLPLAAVAAAHGFVRATSSRRVPPWARAALLLAVCTPPLVQLARLLPATNAEQLARIDFVLDRTPPGEPVYDGDLQFNVFRRDLDYFWFFPKPVRLDTEASRELRSWLFSHLGSAGPGSIRRDPWREDACELVRSARPRIVSDFWLDLSRCGLAGEYRATPFPGLFERRP